MSETNESPVPGSALTTYICVRDCAKAIEWYVDVLGAIEQGQRYAEPDGRVGHAVISLHGGTLMLSDAYPDFGAESPPPGNQTATFALYLEVPDAEGTVAGAQAAGAQVQRPVELQPFGSLLGTIMDPFGVRWMIATKVAGVSQEQLDAQARAYSGTEPGPVQ